jgi:hypothetical protein
MPLPCSSVFGNGVAAFIRSTPPYAPPDAPPYAVKPDIQCVRTHWNRGFMTFQLARRPGDRFARVV